MGVWSVLLLDLNTKRWLDPHIASTKKAIHSLKGTWVPLTLRFWFSAMTQEQPLTWKVIQTPGKHFTSYALFSKPKYTKLESCEDLSIMLPAVLEESFGVWKAVKQHINIGKGSENLIELIHISIFLQTVKPDIPTWNKGRKYPAFLSVRNRHWN